MPITVDDFNTGHMEALKRGMDTATIKFEKLETELERALEREDEAKTQLAKAETQIHKMDSELEERRMATGQVTTLCEMIADVDRGVTEFAELTATVKEWA